MIPPCPQCKSIPLPATHWDKDGKPIWLCKCPQGSFCNDERDIKKPEPEKPKKRRTR